MDKQFYFRGFLVLAIAFALGSFAGGFAARSFGLSQVTFPDKDAVSFAVKLFANSLFPILALLFGTSVIGVLGLPILCGAKGFCLTFAMTSVMIGADSASKIALLRFKTAPAIVSVTVMLLIAAQAMVSSAKLLRLANKAAVSGPIYGFKYRLTVICCLASLVIISLI
ncbi:MAG: hypothetical protein LBD85_02995 [Oscillospiraceae bacterium]|nr:hypothetical protein [Oscillospiraceae bacterium]